MDVWSTYLLKIKYDWWILWKEVGCIQQYLTNENLMDEFDGMVCTSMNDFILSINIVIHCIIEHKWMNDICANKLVEFLVINMDPIIKLPLGMMNLHQWNIPNPIISILMDVWMSLDELPCMKWISIDELTLSNAMYFKVIIGCNIFLQCTKKMNVTYYMNLHSNEISKVRNTHQNKSNT
jgi:hypothetical protein